MTKSTSKIPSARRHSSVQERLQEALIDSFDEELEMEMDDVLLRQVVKDADATVPAGGAVALDRRLYFRELFRLQGELSSSRTGWYAKDSRSSSSSRGATRRAKAA